MLSEKKRPPFFYLKEIQEQRLCGAVIGRREEMWYFARRRRRRRRRSTAKYYGREKGKQTHTRQQRWNGRCNTKWKEEWESVSTIVIHWGIHSMKKCSETHTHRDWRLHRRQSRGRDRGRTRVRGDKRQGCDEVQMRVGQRTIVNSRRITYIDTTTFDPSIQSCGE